ncbi:WW domain-binding protein 11 [Wyeomyia smithii]|uniref:WW domain-binding protein 11 n=1 Tax=Wyeomyia smithii TaxID=174621 RepID=UPI002467C9D7|nr:WW domain-binding protein 11 [Wyeomyia smithii]
MGRRSINTTKSGKYMNPTDQARKEARKKELKKNKKQRQMVRAAVLKGKDPAQLIEEMEKIDEMEFNVYQPSPLNEKVLKEKRKKLKETLDRVMRLYQADDPDLWGELKRKEVDYEKRRNKRIQYYESVRHAEQVQVDDIPLPSANETPTPLSIPRIPIPPVLPAIIPPIKPAPPPVLKKPVENPIEPMEPVDDDDDIPGCPPGPPPDLFAMPELDFDLQEFHNETQKSVKFFDDADSRDNSDDSDVEKPKQPSTVQQKMLAISGQNLDEFMKEMENVQKKKDQLDLAATGAIPIPTKPPIALPNPAPHPSDPTVKYVPMPSIPMPGPIQPALMIRPPPLRPGLPGMPGLRMPPRPPPGIPPRLGIRMPPGPPAGPPPKHIQQQHMRNMLHQQQHKDPKSATISAKPQIRNLSADVTRFVPSTLRTKKDEAIKRPQQNRSDLGGHNQHQHPHHHHHQQQQHHHPGHHSQHYQQQHMHPGRAGNVGAPDPGKPSKDDAYLQFMREMEGLL